MNKAIEDIAKNAKAMNANAVIKTQIHGGCFTPNIYAEGEAVILNSISGTNATPQSNGKAALGTAPGSNPGQAGIPAGKAVVYIYRTIGTTFGPDVKIPFSVKANGNVLTTLVQGGYYRYVTDPCNIEFGAFDTGFMAPTSVFSVTIDAKAGQAYYLKGAHGKGMGGRAHLELVSPQEGASDVATCKEITTQQ